MPTKKTVVLLILSMIYGTQIHSKHQYYSLSFVLCTLSNNTVTIERYSLPEITPGTIKLSAVMRQEHQLFSIGLSAQSASALALFFYPADQRYLVISTEQHKKTAELLFSWIPLITEQKEPIDNLDTIQFSIDQNGKNTHLTTRLTTPREDYALDLLLDQPVQAACGAFIEHSYEQDEFDMMLEESMNSELDFIPKEKPGPPSMARVWFERAGTYLIMRYINLEEKIKNTWHWMRRSA